MKWHWEDQDSFQEPLVERAEVDHGWSDHGPNLRDDQGNWVLGGWGHDAWGVMVKERDAHLIAAAPELLEALEDMLEQLTLQENWQDEKKIAKAQTLVDRVKGEK